MRGCPGSFLFDGLRAQYIVVKSNATPISGVHKGMVLYIIGQHEKEYALICGGKYIFFPAKNVQVGAER